MNSETLQAMLESEMLVNDPNTKTYDSFSEIIEEIHNDAPKSDEIEALKETQHEKVFISHNTIDWN